MPYNSWAGVYQLWAEWYDTKSNIKLGGFQSQLEASYICNHADELWFSETVGLWMTIYIYIYIYILVSSEEVQLIFLRASIYINAFNRMKINLLS